MHAYHRRLYRTGRHLNFDQRGLEEEEDIGLLVNARQFCPPTGHGVAPNPEKYLSRGLEFLEVQKSLERST